MQAVTTTLAPEQVAVPDRGLWRRLPLIGAVLAVAGLGLAVVVGGDRAHLFHAYLVSYLFYLSLALGGLFFVLLQFLTRAGWSVVVRRLAEQVMATLPLFALLFLPLVFGLETLYPWSRPDAVAGDALLQHKAPWLDRGSFLLRAVVYLATWSLLAWWYWRRGRTSPDEATAVAATRRRQTLAAPAMLLYGLTQTFAAFDWVMSLDPHWYSTIFGVYFFSGSTMAILALLILLVLALQRGGALRGVVNMEHIHDLGKLLFGFVVFWAYIAFSQFMLIWYAAIPEETLWFAHRWHGSSQALSIFLVAGHFVIPFFLLLSRDLKRRPLAIAAMSAWLLVMHYVDLYWLVMPSLYPHGVHFALADLLMPLGLGGVFLAVLVPVMRRRALVPADDPRLAESLAFENV